MTATIIQTNNQALQSVEVDGVTVDLIENALRNAREEMDAVLFRTAMSPGIREQGDCFPMIANVEGKMVVGQFGSFIGPFLSAYDAEIEEGDIILTNDPYLGNAAVSHLPDWGGWQMAIDRSIPKSTAADSTEGESSKNSVDFGLNFKSACNALQNLGDSLA